jgi:hypothetical protein
MRTADAAIKSLGTIGALLLVSPCVFAITVAEVSTDTPASFFSGALNATVTLTDPSSGTFSTATAAAGQLKAEIIAKSGPSSALAEFVDSLTVSGPGSTATLQFTEVLNGSLAVGVLGAQASVIATMSVTGLGFQGAQVQYQKSLQFGLPPLQSGALQLVADVPIGTVDFLTTLRVGATGSPAFPSTSDYASTDQIYVTSLTPGVTITSLSNHNYAPVPEPSRAAGLMLGLAMLTLAVSRLPGRAKARLRDDAAESVLRRSAATHAAVPGQKTSDPDRSQTSTPGPDFIGLPQNRNADLPRHRAALPVTDPRHAS